LKWGTRDIDNIFCIVFAVKFCLPLSTMEIWNWNCTTEQGLMGYRENVRLTDFDYPSISWILIFEFVVFKFPFLSHKIYVCSGEDSEWKTHLMNRNDAVSKLLSSTHNAN
jgi:hypothetical protein